MSPQISVYHDDAVTIRVVNTDHSTVMEDAFQSVEEAVKCALEFFGHDPEKHGHLFVTALAASGLHTEDGNGGFGMYQSGLQAISVCAGDAPDELADDREHWLREIAISAVHEVVHYWQDLQGSLDGSEECEDKAERLAQQIWDGELLNQSIKVKD